MLGAEKRATYFEIADRGVWLKLNIWNRLLTCKPQLLAVDIYLLFKHDIMVINSEEPSPVVAEQQPAEPKTFSWANLLNKNGTSSSDAAATAAAPVTATVTPQPSAAGFPAVNTSPTERPHHHKPAPMRGNRYYYNLPYIHQPTMRET